MHALLFYAVYPLLYLLAQLPLSALYRLSDLLYGLVYHVIGYRRQVVRQNLTRAFPEKNEAQIRAIEQGFYRYFCDLIVETVKLLTISRAELTSRCRFQNMAVFEKWYHQKKSVLIAMGHHGNWEWGGLSMSAQSGYQLLAIYKPVSNKHFNRLMQRLRIRFGGRVVAMENTYRELVKSRDELTATAFITDQTPFPANALWLTFLNQDTPVFKGLEVIAKRLDRPIVFATVKRVKRGCYEILLEPLFESPAQTGAGEVTSAHTRKLEAHVREQPETWLWSHRRWKHSKPQP